MGFFLLHDEDEEVVMDLIQVASSLLQIIRQTTNTRSIQVDKYDSDESTMMTLDEMEKVIDKVFYKIH
jgi:hypothetical protein